MPREQSSEIIGMNELLMKKITVFKNSFMNPVFFIVLAMLCGVAE
jgi:hypothetical protein